MSSVRMRMKHILPIDPHNTKPMVLITMGGRTEGPRVGCELRDNSPGPVTVPV